MLIKLSKNQVARLEKVRLQFNKTLNLNYSLKIFINSVFIESAIQTQEEAAEAAQEFLDLGGYVNRNFDAILDGVILNTVEARRNVH